MDKPNPALLPDSTITPEERTAYGYSDDNMLPLREERALELFDADNTVYVLHPNGRDSIILDREDIKRHEGIFGISLDDWSVVLAYETYKLEVSEGESEKVTAFRQENSDCYAIYQLKDDPSTRDYRFESLERLQEKGLTVSRELYTMVYTAAQEQSGNANEDLEQLYGQFNQNPPADFKGHSLSVGDVIALKTAGQISCSYCDRFGFTPLPGFDSGKNHLRSLEDMLEQNDNQLDGIINNTALHRADLTDGQTYDEIKELAPETLNKSEKPSVLEKLNSSKCNKEKPALHKDRNPPELEL